MSANVIFYHLLFFFEGHASCNSLFLHFCCKENCQISKWSKLVFNQTGKFMNAEDLFSWTLILHLLDLSVKVFSFLQSLIFNFIHFILLNPILDFNYRILHNIIGPTLVQKPGKVNYIQVRTWTSNFISLSTSGYSNQYHLFSQDIKLHPSPSITHSVQMPLFKYWQLL